MDKMIFYHSTNTKNTILKKTNNINRKHTAANKAPRLKLGLNDIISGLIPVGGPLIKPL